MEWEHEFPVTRSCQIATVAKTHGVASRPSITTFWSIITHTTPEAGASTGPYYLELYKDYILFDGEIKNHIETINERLLKISTRSEKLIEDKHKLIWPESIDYKTFTGGGGNVKDFNGIDGEVVFEGSVKSVQCKEVSYIEENEDRIIISLTMSYKKYLHVDYYAFTNDKKYIVFKNDSNGIGVLESLSGNIYSFNKDLIVSTNF